MNTFTILLEILGIATSVLKGNTTGQLGQDSAIADALVQIAQKANAAYTAQTGQPMDPSLITNEDIVP